LDLTEAIAKHGQWKMKFRTAIKEKQQIDAAMIAKDDCCTLGQWLHGEGGTRHGTLLQFQILVETHRTFHRVAGKVAQMINGARYAEAEAALSAGTPYAAASSDVGVTILGRTKASVG
jgi:methyl-accepting chemotaxis protein